MLHQPKAFEPTIQSLDRKAVTDMIHAVCSYPSIWIITHISLQLTRHLRPHFAMYHARAVKLVCEIEALGDYPYVESAIAEELSTARFRSMQDAYDAFGVLWRLTGWLHHSSNLCRCSFFV
jgi:hypothetical protein